MKTRGFLFCAMLAALTCLNGCQLDFDDSPADEGQVIVRIGVENSEEVQTGRTVLPQVGPTDISSYELWGDSGTGNRKLATFDPLTITTATVALVPGTWDFSLKALKQNAVILQGDLEDKVISTSANSLSFVLSPVNSGMGNIRITVNFPGNAGIVSAAAVVGDDTESLTISGSSVTYSKTNAPAGNLFVSIQLKDSSDTLVGIVSDLVLVRDNLLSEADFTLDPEDLRFTVIIPAGISATAESDGTVQVTWDETAGAVSYRLYRKAASESEYSFIDESPEASYTDSTALSGTGYAYKVSAVNGNEVESQISAASGSVTVALGISAFVFWNPEAEGVFVTGETDVITVTVPTIVDLTALAPVITHSGASLNPPSGVPQDFSGPVVYTATAPGGSVRTYTVSVTPADWTVAGALSWIGANVKDEGVYSIAITADETLNPTTLSYSMKRVTINLKGRTAERILTLGSDGSLFTIGSQVTLRLDDKATLKGKTNNNASLVSVLAGGRLIIEEGAKISGNSSSASGGGVYVNANGNVTMNGGEISDHTVATSSSYGGGVYIAGGTFTMTGGEISDNTASSSYSPYSYGGGVYVASNGSFIVTDGTIRNNTASTSYSYSSYSYGGGVYVADNGSFALTDGTISNNMASSSSSTTSPYSYGGGVYVASNGSFTVTDGTISNNTASSSSSYSPYSYGGGVYVADNGSFTVTDGTISNNTASSSCSSSSYSYSYGGGVYVAGGALTMTGGETSDNTASSTNDYISGYVRFYGGGLYVSSGTVDIENVAITGNKAYASASSFSGSSSIDMGGGGIYIAGGSVTLTGGEVGENESSYDGGGVYLVDGSFTLDGAAVDGNTVGSYRYGGGIYQAGGTFAMNSGAVTENTAYDGGGLYQAGGTFTLTGGTIGDNSATNRGAGIYSIATLNLNGGEISQNTAENYGGGVYFDASSGTFTLNGARILNNATSSAGGLGGGVCATSGTFLMRSGEISGNRVASSGGGVYSNAAFTISGGAINDNTSTGNGGGVYSIAALFTMNGGTINNNAASGDGGGVYVASGTFKKEAVIGSLTSGVISGSDAAEGVKNIASGSGQAVYVSDGPKVRNITAEQSDTLDSSTASPGGGWE
jgi:hypothetical protein